MVEKNQTEVVPTVENSTSTYTEPWGQPHGSFFLKNKKEDIMSNGIVIKIKPEIIKDAIKKGVEKIQIEIVLKENSSENNKEYCYSGVEALSMRI